MLKHLMAIALLGAPYPAHGSSIPDPVVTVCPPTNADLEYGLYTLMTSARFQPMFRASSWRRRVDGPFHIPSLDSAQYLHVDFVTFKTSVGTRLVAQMRWRTSTYEFGVKQQHLVDGMRAALDGLAAHYPC
jgi:hypothetical protein